MFSFAAGKGSALVIDIGHSTTSVTPVVDGFVLRKGNNIHTKDRPVYLAVVQALFTLHSPNSCMHTQSIP